MRTMSRDEKKSSAVAASPAAAFGVVLHCRRRISLARVRRLLEEYAKARCHGVTLPLTEESDWGSLVSPRPEAFHFLQVATGDAIFSLCRFRECEGGYEFLFNLSNTRDSPYEIEQFLLASLPAEIVKREMF
ncbi:MAG TPA: hypothetical protein VJO34_09085 [Methylomirabilota bacterium]|nr:hypothetical protein [Methylomirabilota bacterium]